MCNYTNEMQKHNIRKRLKLPKQKVWYKAFLITNNWESSGYNSSDGPFSGKRTDVQFIEENTKSTSFVHKTVFKD